MYHRHKTQEHHIVAHPLNRIFIEINFGKQGIGGDYEEILSLLGTLFRLKLNLFDLELLDDINSTNFTTLLQTTLISSGDKTILYYSTSPVDHAV